MNIEAVFLMQNFKRKKIEVDNETAKQSSSSNHLVKAVFHAKNFFYDVDKLLFP